MASRKARQSRLDWSQMTPTTQQSRTRATALDSSDETDDDAGVGSSAQPVGGALPTPIKSSQSQEQVKGNRRRGKGRQGVLDFGGHTGFSLPSERRQRIKPRGDAKSFAGVPANWSKRGGGVDVDLISSSDEAEENDDLLQLTQDASKNNRAPKSGEKRKRGRSPDSVLDSSSNEEGGIATKFPQQQQQRQEEPMSRMPASKPRRLRSKLESSNEAKVTGRFARKPAIVISTDEEETKEEDIIDTNEVDIGEAETSSDEVMFCSPALRRARLARQSAHAAQTYRGPYTTKNGRDDGFVVDEETTEDEDRPEASRKSKQKERATPKDKGIHKHTRRRHKYDVVEDNGSVVDYEDGELQDYAKTHQPKEKGQAPQQVASASSDESEIVVSSAKRRRLTQRKAGDTRRARLEQEDLAEDLDFLGVSNSSPSRLRSSATSKKHDPRADALEEFKRRRAGQADALALPEETPSRRRQRGKALYDTDSEHEPLPDNLLDDDSDDDDVRGPSADSGQIFNEDDYDKGFVVEDDEDDPIGVPPMPIEFTNLARSKGRNLFKYAVEFMVQKKINPGFDHERDVYRLTFQKLDDEVKGLAGSKFMSSAWKAEFLRSLKNRPQIDVSKVGSDGIQNCEACGKSGHPATFEIQFKGKPYDRKTLEEVERGDSEDSNESSDSDAPDYDGLNNEIPAPSTVYHCGKTCAKNAQTAHTFEHWRFHLNEWVADWLQRQAYLEPAKIVRRDGWKMKKRQREALRITDEMEAAGEVKMLYRAFRAEIEAAHEAKGSGYTGLLADE